MDNFAGKVAVVTGAGSGIGQELALELARRGARPAISDVDTEGLARTEQQIRDLGADVKADLSTSPSERRSWHTPTR